MVFSSCFAALRIVVVEDEALVSQFIEAVLVEAGAAVIGVARSVDEALECIERMRPNAVTLDGNLRGTLSSDVAARLNELGVRYLVISGANLGSDEHLSAAPRLGKPFTPESLKAAVAQYLC